MKTLFWLLTIGTAQAGLTTYTDLDLFTLDLPGVIQTQTLGQTVVLLNTAAPREFSTGSPMIAAGLTLDTRPAGPGAGIKFSVRYADGTVEDVGFWYADIVGFRGVIATRPFMALLVNAGESWRTGLIQETITFSTFTTGKNSPPSPEPLPSHMPEPGGLLLVPAGLGVIWWKRRNR